MNGFVCNKDFCLELKAVNFGFSPSLLLWKLTNKDRKVDLKPTATRLVFFYTVMFEPNKVLLTVRRDQTKQLHTEGYLQVFSIPEI